MTFERNYQVLVSALLLAMWLGYGAALAQAHRDVLTGASLDMSASRRSQRELLRGMDSAGGRIARQVRGRAATSTTTPPDVVTPLTIIPLTVTDKSGAVFTTALRPQDIRLLEDGVPQEIIELTQRADIPRWVILGLDTSISQENVLPAAKEAARRFVDTVLRPDKDRAAMYSFSGSAVLRQPLTSEFQLVRAALQKLTFEPPTNYLGGGIIIGRPPPVVSGQPSPGSTSLWGGMATINEQVFMPSGSDALRAIVILTDGQDTSGEIKQSEAIKRLLRSGVIVYAIGIGDDKFFEGVDKGALRRLAERTGGLAFFPRKGEELLAALHQIGLGLHGQHFISYRPSRKNSVAPFHELKIEIINPVLRKQGLRLAHPQGYFTANPNSAQMNASVGVKIAQEASGVRVVAAGGNSGY